MSVGLTYVLEMEFSGAGNGWTDVSADVDAGTPIVWDYGIRDTGIDARVADPGTLTLALKNGPTNSAHLVGYYSPYHANVRAGFALGIGVRLRLSDGTSTVTRFVGRVCSIVPVAGQYGKRTTQIAAYDFMRDATEFRLANLDTLVDVQSNTVISTILDAMPVQPAARLLGTGMDLFPYALDSARDESSTALTEFQRVAASELGYVYQRGDGTFVFEDRSQRANTTANAYTLNGTMTGLDAPVQDNDIVNLVQATVHTRRVDPAATTVLYSLQSMPSVDPGSSLTLLGPYRDPAQRAARVGAVTSSMVNPVATTDYTMNSAADGSGSDLTLFFTVSANFGGNGVRFTVTNNGATLGYITKLQCRGKGIYDFETAVMEASDAASQARYGQRVQSLDMPYQTDPDIGQEAASYLLNVRSSPFAGARTVSFLANYSSAHRTVAMSADIGTRIGLIEPVTALSDTISGSTATRGFFINAVRGEFSRGQIVRMTYRLEPSYVNQYWLLGVTGASELGDTTRLGYSLFENFWLLGTAGFGELGVTTRMAR